MTAQSTPGAALRAWVEVDLGALVRNARTMMACAGKRLIPMVKADAYGLGVLPVVRALEAVDPLMFGVATIPEGEELRAAGVERPILIVTPLLEGDLPAIRAARLTPTLASSDTIRAWRTGGGGDWHLGIDTGMSRAGIRWDQVAVLADELRLSPPSGVYSHFHSSELDDGSVDEQTTRFRAALAKLPLRPALVHMENSGAIARVRGSAFDCVRPGVFLYGVGSGEKAFVQPEPVAHLRARVVELRDVHAGEGVSYDATWRARETRRIATIAIGYADGYRRHLGNKGRALIGGREVPVVGNVTMDLTMLDVTGVPCVLGDAATLLGTDGDRTLTAEEVAGYGGLSPYELLTGLRQRLPRPTRGEG